jgi:hypothetical protein
MNSFFGRRLIWDRSGSSKPHATLGALFAKRVADNSAPLTAWRLTMAAKRKAATGKKRSKFRASWHGQLRLGLVSSEVQAVNAENQPDVAMSRSSDLMAL